MLCRYMHHKHFTQVVAASQTAYLYETFGITLARNRPQLSAYCASHAGTTALIDTLHLHGARLCEWWHDTRRGSIVAADINWPFLALTSHASHHANTATAGEDDLP